MAYKFSIILIGPTCPKQMHDLNGKCYGIARNSYSSNLPSDKNCNWHSEDNNLKLSETPIDQVGANPFKKFPCLIHLVLFRKC